jgi:hypothetical protein
LGKKGRDGGGVPSDGVEVVEVGVLLVEPQHLLERTRGVEGLLLTFHRWLCHKTLFYFKFAGEFYSRYQNEHYFRESKENKGKDENSYVLSI